MQYLYSIYGFITTDVIIKAIVLSGMCLFITICHSYTYRYILNKSFIFTSLMLGPLVLAVTTVIATNLYLSLGMIGALSIVRYRTPVKSQYELALFFSFICLGIISGVNFGLAIKVFFLLLLIPFLYEFFIKKIFYSKLNQTDFEKPKNIVIDIIFNDINATNIIKKYNFKNNLIKIETNNETKETYISVVYSEIDEALNTKKNLELNDKVKNINLTHA